MKKTKKNPIIIKGLAPVASNPTPIRVVCQWCHGLGYRELPNGDTIECIRCDGKGSK